jgi:NADH:ubiquinone oxidoreductase subunit 5 (subunit L)/multisubunit Na+/H+ antiporter MnhA subunit
VELLLLGWIVLPAVTGVVLLAAASGRTARVLRWTGLAVALVASLCAALALRRAGEPIWVAFEWLPGTGRMALEAGASGLHAAAWTTWSACLVLLATWSDLGQTGAGPRTMGLVLIGIAAACVAFLSTHFILRYVALELVALCVACAPLAERADQRAATLSPFVYLVLRFGDAWLLLAIATLGAATGTLDIAPALHAGEALRGSAMTWIAVGLLLAVWVKIGGLPFHVWVRAGRACRLRAYAWLYVTVMPNLGLYLLYRTAPLLSQAGIVRIAAAWLGAGGAAVAAYLALARADEGYGAIEVAAAHGGLALLLGAYGLKGSVWIGIPALTLLRTLFHLAAGLRSRGWVRALLLACSALATAAWGVYMAFWASAANLPAALRIVAEGSVALLIVWAVAISVRGISDARREARAADAVHWTHWAVVAALGATLLAAVAVSAPLVDSLARASNTTLPAGVSRASLSPYLSAGPAIWLALPLTLLAWGLGWRFPAPRVALLDDEQALVNGLARAGQAPRDAIEVGVLERAVTAISQGTVRIAEWQRRSIEQGLLEHGVTFAVRATVGGAAWVWRAMELEGIEALPRRAAQAALAVGRALQRRHTGQLRRNLLWVVAGLLLAFAVVFLAW